MTVAFAKPGKAGGGSGRAGDERNPAQDRKLSDQEIQILLDAGIGVHDLKGGENAAKHDLYKDRKGNIYVKPKGGAGPGEPTNLNINDFRCSRVVTT